MEKLHNLIRERISFEYLLVKPDLIPYNYFKALSLLDDDIFSSIMDRLTVQAHVLYHTIIGFKLCHIF